MIKMQNLGVERCNLENKMGKELQKWICGQKWSHDHIIKMWWNAKESHHNLCYNGLTLYSNVHPCLKKPQWIPTSNSKHPM
jgi:hypothetical protein